MKKNTMNYTKDEIRDMYVYNPDVKYYFLSVMYCGKAPAWIRKPFLTENEIQEFLKIYCNSKKKEFSSLEIFNEALLREKITVLKKDGGYIDIGLRHWIFDDRYTSDDDYYSDIISGKEPMYWKDGYEEWLELSKETKLEV